MQTMNNTLRGRPRLNIPLDRIIQAVRRHGYVMRAARELSCSDAYIHGRLKNVGLGLRDVLEAQSVEVLLHGR